MKAFRMVSFCAVLAGLAAGCSSPAPSRPTDPAVATAASTARLAFDQGKIEQAAQLYLRALTRARSMDDSYEIANNAYNLAACLITLGSYEPALSLLQEADRETVRSGGSRVDILLLQARAAQKSGQPEAARKRLDEAMALADQPEIRIQVDVLLASIACDTGDVAAAESLLKRAETGLDKNAGPMIQAEVQGLAGRVASMQKKPEEAALRLDRQAAYLQKGGKYRDMAQVLGQAAAYYAEAGKWAEAWDRAYRAARSLYAQGDLVGSLRQVEQAVAAAEKEGAAPSRQAETARLFEEIRKAAQQADSAEK